MKFELICTDGYSLDITKYDTFKEAQEAMTKAYNELNKNQPGDEWDESSHLDYSSAILYEGGNNVYCWDVHKIASSDGVLGDIDIPKEYISGLIKQYGKEQQPVICIEELSELQKEICKFMRGKGDVEHITEEITHCLISISVIMEMIDIDKEKIQQHIANKIKQYGTIGNI